MTKKPNCFAEYLNFYNCAIHYCDIVYNVFLFAAIVKSLQSDPIAFVLDWRWGKCGAVNFDSPSLYLIEWFRFWHQSTTAVPENNQELPSINRVEDKGLRREPFWAARSRNSGCKHSKCGPQSLYCLCLSSWQHYAPSREAEVSTIKFSTILCFLSKKKTKFLGSWLQHLCCSLSLEVAPWAPII